MDSNKNSDSESVADTNSNEVKAGSSRATASIIGGIALIAIAGVGYWAYQGQQKADQLAQDLARMEAKIGGVHANLQGIEQTQGDYKNQLETKVQELNQNLSHQTNRLEQLGGSQNWKLYEARYLLVLAGERLQAFDDVTTAKRLIQAADQRVLEMASPNTLKVRQALANDLASLNAIQVPDIQGIWVQLGALNTQFEKLEFFNLDDPAKRPVLQDEQNQETHQATQSSQAQQQADTQATAPADESGWKRSIKDSWQELKGLVKVREYNPESFSLVLNSQEQAQLLSMMQMLVEQARWAATHKNQVIYVGSLEDLQVWVERYFVDDEVKAAALKQLETLKATQIQFEAPDLISLNQLNALMQYDSEASVKPSSPKPNPEDTMKPDPLAQEAWPSDEEVKPLEEVVPQVDESTEQDIVPDDNEQAGEADEVNADD